MKTSTPLLALSFVLFGCGPATAASSPSAGPPDATATVAPATTGGPADSTSAAATTTTAAAPPDSEAKKALLAAHPGAKVLIERDGQGVVLFATKNPGMYAVVRQGTSLQVYDVAVHANISAARIEDVNGDSLADLLVESPSAEKDEPVRHGLFLAPTPNKKAPKGFDWRIKERTSLEWCTTKDAQGTCTSPMLYLDVAAIPTVSGTSTLDAAVTAARAIPNKSLPTDDGCAFLVGTAKKDGFAQLSTKDALFVGVYPSLDLPYSNYLVPLLGKLKSPGEDKGPLEAYQKILGGKPLKGTKCPIKSCEVSAMDEVNDRSCFACSPDRPVCMIDGGGTYTSFQWFRWESDKPALIAFSVYDSAG